MYQVNQYRVHTSTIIFQLKYQLVIFFLCKKINVVQTRENLFYLNRVILHDNSDTKEFTSYEISGLYELCNNYVLKYVFCNNLSVRSFLMS